MPGVHETVYIPGDFGLWKLNFKRRQIQSIILCRAFKRLKESDRERKSFLIDENLLREKMQNFLQKISLNFGIIRSKFHSTLFTLQYCNLLIIDDKSFPENGRLYEKTLTA